MIKLKIYLTNFVRKFVAKNQKSPKFFSTKGRGMLDLSRKNKSMAEIAKKIASKPSSSVVRTFFFLEKVGFSKTPKTEPDVS
jgi:hypothetical protein